MINLGLISKILDITWMRVGEGMVSFEVGLMKLKNGECDALKHEQSDCVLMTYDREAEQFKKAILKENGLIHYQSTEFVIREEFYHAKWELIQDGRHLIFQKHQIYEGLLSLREMLNQDYSREFSQIYRMIEQMR